MTSIFRKRMLHAVSLAAVGAGLLATSAFTTQAQARVFVGFGFPLYFGPPAYVPPPVYYPPPAYYPPPPVVYAPPPAYSPMPAHQSCYAGSYVCPMERPVPYGASCYCGTPYGGRVWGHAN